MGLATFRDYDGIAFDVGRLVVYQGAGAIPGGGTVSGQDRVGPASAMLLSIRQPIFWGMGLLDSFCLN